MNFLSACCSVFSSAGCILVFVFSACLIRWRLSSCDLSMESRYCGENGFVMYADAPQSSPCICSSSSVLAVSSMTGIWHIVLLSFIIWQNWYPSSSYIMTSEMMSSGFMFSMSWYAVCGFR